MSPRSPIRITLPGKPFMFFRNRPLELSISADELAMHLPSSRFQRRKMLSWWRVHSQLFDAFRMFGAGHLMKQ